MLMYLCSKWTNVRIIIKLIKDLSMTAELLENIRRDI